MIKYNVNTCDQPVSEVMIHFTKACPNKCPFCVDMLNKGVGMTSKPDIDAIFCSIIKIKDKITCITITGGEPFIYIDELLELCCRIKKYTTIKLGVITSVPSTCYNEYNKFLKIINLLDFISISPQHYNENIADKMRGNISSFDRQEFYCRFIDYLNFYNKIDMCTVNINVCKPYLYEKDDILTCIKYYNDIGFKNIKLCEMFDRDDMFVNIEHVLGIKLKSPFAHGCLTKNYNIKKLIPGFNGNISIKRVCFYKCKYRHAGFLDIIKILTRQLFAKKYFFGVIHENGELLPYWVL